MSLYLDHMASTPLEPEVREAMLMWMDGSQAANPHSQHGPGWKAAKAVEAARAQVAGLVGAKPSEIIFTSGATEANNLALFGVADRYEHLIISAIEHPAVLEPAVELNGEGKVLTVLRPDGSGQVDMAKLETALKEEPAMVSIMAANNEIGVLQDIRSIGALCRASRALFHTDAVQALSSQAIDVCRDDIDLLSLSGHKIYGPAGIGALFVRDGIEVEPRVFGGGHQRGVRPGTLPVALCVGLGKACEIVARRRDEDASRIAGLRDQLLAGLRAMVADLIVNTPDNAVPGCLSVTLPGVDAAELLLDTPGMAASTGSACSSLESSPSHVLRAIGLSAEQAHGTLRFGLGRHTSANQIDAALSLIAAALPSADPIKLKA